MPFVAGQLPAVSEAPCWKVAVWRLRGAFTGARQAAKWSLFEAAHKRRFSSVSGDLPLTLQTRLLRVLQEQEICA